MEISTVELQPALNLEPSDTPPSSKTIKAKTTLNLQGLFKPQAIAADLPEEINKSIAKEPVTTEKLLEVWSEFAEQRKNQAAEYQILKRKIQFDYPVISVILTNPVEDTLLENFRHDFIQFLRERLQNSELTITASMQAADGKKVIYTSKEKFEHLAEKNPYLNEVRERLGLDWDF